MSAWIVTNDHIAAMVELAIGGGADADRVYWDELGDGHGKQVGRFADDRQRIGQILVDENHRSINHRYPGDDDSGTYRQPDYLQNPTAVEGIKIVHCYRYQSCEHPGWETSPAYRLCEAILEKLAHQIPGYDAAPWGWEGPKDGAKVYSLMDMIGR
jgi:hypothetical protein